MIHNKNYPRYMGDIPMDGMPWKKSWDRELASNIREGYSIDAMATHFGRTQGSIVERLKKTEPIFYAYWNARCSANNNSRGVSFYQSLNFLFEVQPETEETVEIKIDGQEILDILSVQKAKLLIDHSNSNELIKDWVKDELKRHQRKLIFVMSAGLVINAIAAGIAAAIILY